MIIDPKLKYSGIYCIINIHNGRTYIGSAINIYIRWHCHVQELKSGKHGNVYLRDAFKKHGLIGLVFSVVERVDDKTNLIAREQFYMERFKSIVPNGYNILPIAGSRLGTKASDETKLKQSVARQRYVTSDETKAKISAAHTGRIITDIHKERLSKAAKGVLKTEAHKQSLKVASRKRWNKIFETMTVINNEPN